MKKEILFVINTLGNAGAEKSLIRLLSVLNPTDYEIYLYVMLNQGDLISDLPPYVHLLNKNLSPLPVLNASGRKHLILELVKSFFRHGAGISTFFYSFRVGLEMLKRKDFRWDKLLWKMVAVGAPGMSKEFDLAIAFLEGASSYFVADYVKAKKKLAWVHVDMESAGYTPLQVENCYDAFDHIFAVSEDVKKSFLNIYPKGRDKTDIFENLIDEKEIKSLAKKDETVEFDANAFSILSVGRLHEQKAYDLAIQAMDLIRRKKQDIKWYVIGDGPERERLLKRIRELGLEEHFFLLGAKKNPYPYFLNCDLYVHATAYEGKSVAIAEAQCLGKAVIASDVSGNREQLTDGYDGVICDLDEKALAEAVLNLVKDENLRRKIEANNQKKIFRYEKKDLDRILCFLREDEI